MKKSTEEMSQIWFWSGGTVAAVREPRFTGDGVDAGAAGGGRRWRNLAGGARSPRSVAGLGQIEEAAARGTGGGARWMELF